MQVLHDVSHDFKAHLDPSHGHLHVEWPTGQAVLALSTCSVVPEQESLPDDVGAWLRENESYLRRWDSILRVGLPLGQAA